MSAKRNRRFLLVISVLIFLAAACSLPNRQSSPSDTAPTQAQKTIEALMTQVAGTNITATPNKSRPATATAPHPTLLPSSTPLPTATRIILPSPAPTQVCDQARFIADVTIPDGTAITAGSQFVKTWRLQNTGSCTWTPGYAIVFDSGDAMGGPSAQDIGETVAPGETIELSVTLKAPASLGPHRGNWRLRNDDGVLFGVGSKTGKFYVDIKVVPVPSADSGFDFVANVCLAEWTARGKTIPCMGQDGSSDGFVLLLNQPALETGYIDDESGLLTNPPKETDGVIRGKYPAYTVKDGDHFRTILGCQNKAKNCNVRFKLDYQIEGGSIQNFASWNESYDEQFTRVDEDLSSLAGERVRFILTVTANGESNNDRALWLLPRIKP